MELLGGSHTPSGTVFPKSEVVGWADIGTSSRPITGVVIGREMRGIVSNDSEDIKIRVQTYVKPYGNDYPLSIIKDAALHEGWSGKEFEITHDYSPERAMQMQYSPNSIYKLTEGEALFISTLVTSLPLMEGFEGMQAHHTTPPAHQWQQA